MSKDGCVCVCVCVEDGGVQHCGCCVECKVEGKEDI